MKKLYKFHWDCGRAGNLYGVFIAEESDVKTIIGEDAYFGSVLGKHSEVHGTVKPGDITEMSDDQGFIAKMESVFGGQHISGHSILNAVALSKECRAEDEL